MLIFRGFRGKCDSFDRLQALSTTHESITHVLRQSACDSFDRLQALSTDISGMQLGCRQCDSFDRLQALSTIRQDFAGEIEGSVTPLIAFRR